MRATRPSFVLFYFSQVMTKCARVPLVTDMRVFARIIAIALPYSFDICRGGANVDMNTNAHNPRRFYGGSGRCAIRSHGKVFESSEDNYHKVRYTLSTRVSSGFMDCAHLPK